MRRFLCVFKQVIDFDKTVVSNTKSTHQIYSADFEQTWSFLCIAPFEIWCHYRL